MNNQIILDFINAYFDKTDNFFITIINNATGRTKNYYHNIYSFKQQLNKIIYANNTDSIYFTINNYKNFDDCHLNNHKQPSKIKNNVKGIKSLIFDFDNPTTSLNDLKYLIETFNIKPSYILQTSPGKYQICFLLNDKNVNLDLFEKVNKTLAYYFNSDINVCSMEKVFRLPGFINRKNDFETKLINQDFSRIYNFSIFEDFVNNTSNDKMIDSKNMVNNTKNIPAAPKIKVEKVAPKIETKLQKLDKSIFPKYQNMLKYSDNDASVADIKYIKDRRKVISDFDTIFNEIMFLREKLKHPLKRDYENYYNDRYNLFLEN